jgi:hypothetical protein
MKHYSLNGACLYPHPGLNGFWTVAAVFGFFGLLMLAVTVVRCARGKTASMSQKATIVGFAIIGVVLCAWAEATFASGVSVMRAIEWQIVTCAR